MLEWLDPPTSQALAVEGGGQGLYFQVVGLDSWIPRGSRAWSWRGAWEGPVLDLGTHEMRQS